MNSMLSENDFNIFCLRMLNYANWFCVSNLNFLSFFLNNSLNHNYTCMIYKILKELIFKTIFALIFNWYIPGLCKFYKLLWAMVEFLINNTISIHTSSYRFHLFIFRPVLPYVSCHQALPPTRSPRPHLTFETDQIQQHAKRYEDATQLLF
jgi:hypothetical protein